MKNTYNLTDEKLIKFLKDTDSFMIYVHFYNGLILEYPVECYYEESEQPFNCGVFMSSEDFDHVYLSDPNLYKITDKADKSTLWERSKSDSLNSNYDTSKRKLRRDWQIC